MSNKDTLQPYKLELPEGEAYMLQRDLDRFAKHEDWATAYSVAVSNAEAGKSVPLITEARLRTILADAHAHYEAQVISRTGLAEPADDPGMPNPWRDALLAAARARNWVVSGDDKPEHLLDLIARVDRIDAASPHQQRLREMASLVEQLHGFANRLAPYLLPHEVTGDMACAGGVPPDTLLPDTRVAAVAWANGAQLQFRYRGSDDEWRDCNHAGRGICLPNFLRPEIEYREKP